MAIRHTVVALTCLTGATLIGIAAAQNPVSDSDFVWIEPPVKQVGVSEEGAQFDVAVMLDNSTVLGAIALPLSCEGLPGLSIDTNVVTPPDIVGVTYGPAGRSPQWIIKTTYLDNSQRILAGFITFTSFPQTADTLCYIHFDVAPNTGGSVFLDSTFILVSSLTITGIDAVDYTPTWTPSLLDIGVGLPGDMDCDNEVTVGDIIYLVNYIFKSGPEPCSPEAADVDCDSQIVLPDVIWLVNYLFRGGPLPLPPCD